MEEYISRSDIKIPCDFATLSLGKILREKGYILHNHSAAGYSVELPSGEKLSEKEMITKFNESKDDHSKGELREGLLYLILCEEKLCKMPNLKFKLS